jgi:excisionase family DNA binding protein
MIPPKTPAEPSDDYFGTFYTAKLLDLSVGTVQSLVEKNELQAWRTRGGHRRISMRSIMEYQQRHNIKGNLDRTRQPRIKVLIVDDDSVTLDLIRVMIEEWGFPVDCTLMASALEALLDFNVLRPDVLITDLRMQGVDGFELLKTLSSTPAANGTAIVALTSMSAEEIKERDGLPGSTIVCQKPINTQWLNGFFSALVSLRQEGTGHIVKANKGPQDT